MLTLCSHCALWSHHGGDMEETSEACEMLKHTRKNTKKTTTIKPSMIILKERDLKARISQFYAAVITKHDKEKKIDH